MDLSQALRILPFLTAVALCSALPSVASPGGLQPLPPSSDDDSCFNTPLVSVDWGELRIPALGLDLGNWVLPPSSDSPELRTNVSFRAWIEHRATGAHALVLEFSYSNENELGIPFGLQKVEFSVLTRQGRVTTSLDWTNRCNIGNLPSLLPGDMTMVTLEVPGPKGKEVLFGPQLRFWGSLN